MTKDRGDTGLVTVAVCRGSKGGWQGVEDENYEELKELALREGVSLFGVGDLEAVRSSFHSSIRETARVMRYGVSIGFRLSDLVLETIVDRPTLMYKHHYKTVNWLLDRVAYRCANLIEAMGFRALPIPASQIVDWDSQLGHVSHILAARQAGLGWIGKSNLLVNPEYGARVRYSTILTDIPLRIDSPIAGDCGTCRDCLAVCPAGAITENGYDKGGCLVKLREFAKLRGIGVSICGLCVKACAGRAVSDRG